MLASCVVRLAAQASDGVIESLVQLLLERVL